MRIDRAENVLLAGMNQNPKERICIGKDDYMQMFMNQDSSYFFADDEYAESQVEIFLNPMCKELHLSEILQNF